MVHEFEYFMKYDEKICIKYCFDVMQKNRKAFTGNSFNFSLLLKRIVVIRTQGIEKKTCMAHSTRKGEHHLPTQCVLMLPVV